MYGRSAFQIASEDSDDDFEDPWKGAPSLDADDAAKAAHEIIESMGPEPSPLMLGSDVGLLPFLRGTGTDIWGRHLEEILQWDFDQMEKVHDYIQWIFPTNEPSMFNPHAPVLTPQDQFIIQGDLALQSVMQRSLEKFCAFLGLVVLRACGDVPPVVIQKAPHFEERIGTCWEGGFGGNHNWFRISRALHCLRLVGLHNEAMALLACLEELHAEGVRCSAALQHWRQRAAICCLLKEADVHDCEVVDQATNLEDQPSEKPHAQMQGIVADNSSQCNRDSERALMNHDGCDLG
eukprot:gnl/MRDRNA2_/MRDRNA2_28731_c0_seq1.p1 gnl/MRDRNA2_/MRDRNA2_28731_c0~~gnl/MRDRNA2_/MRDRNA2_28731_c0_seq1.p1  ORF type:complete len:292 (+),score=52.01 gnl/MRDRNA2_/MRDRNA2_28731_c0_seq1:126-1001(+)